MYSKTIAALIVSLLGTFGVAQFATEAEVAKVIDMALAIFGVLMAWRERVNKGDIHITGKRKVDDVTFHPL